MNSVINPKQPFLKVFLFSGVIICVVSAFVFSSLLLGFSILALFICCGLLWNINEPPVLPFCFAFQFAFILTGYLFYLTYDYYPELIFVGELEKAVFFSVTGLLIVMIGIRTAFWIFRKTIVKNKQLKVENVSYYIPVLFWVVIFTNVINLFTAVNPSSIFNSGSQFILYTLSFRNVFVFLLFLEILKQRKGYRYGIVAFVFLIIPTFASFFSDFKFILFMIVILIASEIKPSGFSRIAKSRNKIIIISFIVVLIATFFLALYWEGGAKKTWRGSIRAGDVSGTPLQKAEQFKDHFARAHKNFDFKDNLEDLSARLSSTIGYFSYVIQRVPKIVPFENGALTKRAIDHIVKPRILFPDKPSLGGDSWLVRKYAGIWVAGEELNASIGLGYIPQFYIDFGVYGVLFLSLLYGFIIGIFYKLLLLASPSYNMYFSASSILLLNCFTAFEGEIAKLLGATIINFVIFFILLKFIGKFLHKRVLTKKSHHSGRFANQKQFYINR